MRVKYVTRAATDDDIEWIEDTPPRTMMIMEDDDGPINTGLVDACGVPIYRTVEREPMGFQIK